MGKKRGIRLIGLEQDVHSRWGRKYLHFRRGVRRWVKRYSHKRERQKNNTELRDMRDA